MRRRAFIKYSGLSAFAVSMPGKTILGADGNTITECATSTDLLGPFFRHGAPTRNDISYAFEGGEIPLKVIGQVFGADCNTPLPKVWIDVWHCDHNKDYNMDREDYRCRGRFQTDENGKYWFKTSIPPPYGGRPKHIHYLVEAIEGYQELITQLYFKGDKRIKAKNWIKYPWDEKRILEIYKNEEELAEVSLDLYLKKV